MKISYLANIRVPSEKGETLQIMKMCSALANSGKDVDLELVVPRRRNTMKVSDPFEYYGVEENFKITRLPIVDFMPWRFVFGKWAFRANYWLFSHFAAFYACRIKNPDIVYSRDWRTLYLLRNGNCELIFELHDFRPQDSEGYKAIEPACSSIVVITQGLKKKLISIGIPEKKIVIAPDAVDIEEFDIDITQSEARDKLRLDRNQKLVIYTGHLFRWKGAHTLIDAFEILHKQEYEAKLVLVGGMEEDIARVKKSISEKGIENIIVVGHRPYREISLYLKAADIVVMADSMQYDISREYTSPLKLFQYMAARKPIVAPTTPALLEILNTDNAWPYSPDDPKSLATTLKYALEHPDESEKKVEHAWQEVKKYTWVNRRDKIFKDS